MSKPPALFKDFSFPTNVCAYALALEESLPENLHQGLFLTGIESLREAQAHASELLLSRIPKEACKILDVGVGLGTVLGLLLDTGHTAQGISSDASRLAYVRSRLGDNAPVTCVRLEDFVTENPFDFILFHETAHCSDPLDLFNKALDLLKPSGKMIIIGEFAEDSHDALLSIENLTQLASRFGFDATEQLDLSTSVAPSLDRFLQVVEKHRECLCRDIDITPVRLDEWIALGRRHQKAHVDGHRKYALLQFEKGTAPRWRLGRLNGHHTNQTQKLFEQTFGYQVDPALWQWKYGAGRGVQLGVWSGRELVAHYGGMPRAIHYFGTPHSAVQIGDVMVLGSERGVLTRSGPFFLMASSFLERYIGLGKLFLLGFGFPQERAMRLAERLGLYTEVGKMTEVIWTPLPKTPKWMTRLTKATVDDTSLRQQIDALWLEMAADLSDSIVGVRNWHYLCHRYLAHPTNLYEVYAVHQRLTGRCLGALVLRRTNERCELIDLVAPLKAIPTLVEHARRLAGLGGSTTLQCGITENFNQVFSGQEISKKSMDIRIPTSIWGAVPDPDGIKNQWWLMLGDTDFR